MAKKKNETIKKAPTPIDAVIEKIEDEIPEENDNVSVVDIDMDVILHDVDYSQKIMFIEFDKNVSRSTQIDNIINNHLEEKNKTKGFILVINLLEELPHYEHILGDVVFNTDLDRGCIVADIYAISDNRLEPQVIINSIIKAHYYVKCNLFKYGREATIDEYLILTAGLNKVKSHISIDKLHVYVEAGMLSSVPKDVLIWQEIYKVPLDLMIEDSDDKSSKKKKKDKKKNSKKKKGKK